MSTADLALRGLVMLIWLLYVAAIVLFDWRGASILYYVVNVTGIVGLCVAAMWVFFEGRWRYATVAVSMFLAVLYVGRWVIQIYKTYIIEPDLGLWVAIRRIAEALSALFAKQERELGVLWAVLELYWDVLILPLLLIMIVLLLRAPVARPSDATA